jgi:hypothetical protein
MKPENAESEFEQFARTSGKQLELLGAREGFELMLDFYRSVRAEGCNMEHDGDMLLFQWGVSERDGRNQFVFDITRQFISEGGEDEDISQLGLTFTFDSRPDFESIEGGNKWCGSVSEITEFERFVKSHPATTAVGERNDAIVRLSCGCAG